MILNRGKLSTKKTYFRLKYGCYSYKKDKYISEQIKFVSLNPEIFLVRISGVVSSFRPT